MRWRGLVFLAGLGVSLGFPAVAQTPPELWQFCTDPHPEVRIIACQVIIDSRQETGQALADAFTSRGTAYSITGNQDRAIEDFTQALMLDPNRPLVLGYRGSAYLSKGDYDRAIADLSRVVELAPSFIDALYDRAGAYRGKGDNTRAIEDYTRVLELDPDHEEAIAYRGVAYRAKDEIERALADFTKWFRLDPYEPGAYNLRGLTYRDKGDLEAAIADFDQALRLERSDARLFDNRGVTNFLAGRFAEAGADFVRALELQPAYAYDALWLGLARRKAGQPEREEMARNAARLDLDAWPGPLIRLYLGEASEGDIRTAATAGEDAKVRAERACEAAFYIGELSLVRGDTAQAVIQLQEAVATCPHGFGEYAAALSELKRLR